jgi:hypothetical protein
MEPKKDEKPLSAAEWGKTFIQNATVQTGSVPTLEEVRKARNEYLEKFPDTNGGRFQERTYLQLTGQAGSDGETTFAEEMQALRNCLSRLSGAHSRAVAASKPAKTTSKAKTHKLSEMTIEELSKLMDSASRELRARLKEQADAKDEVVVTSAELARKTPGDGE